MPDVSIVPEPSLVIAIDGPSGSGTSSTARALASALCMDYLDTGSLYRALVVGWTRRGVQAADAVGVAVSAATLPLGINTDPADFGVRLAGSDVTAQLHTPQVSGIVSGYARIAEARGWLIARMRQIIAERGRIVVEGRDITTVVAPDAQVRVLLKADATARIARRTAQLNGAADRVTVTDQVIGRDRVDALTSDFEHPAHGVVVIDSTDLSLAQVVERIAGLVPAPLRHSPKR